MSQHYRSSRAQRFGRTISFGSSSEESQDEEEESPLTARFKAKRRASQAVRREKNLLTTSQTRQAPPVAHSSFNGRSNWLSSSGTARGASQSQCSTNFPQPLIIGQADTTGPTTSSSIRSSTLQASLHLPASPISPRRSERASKAPPACACCQGQHSNSSTQSKTPAKRHRHKQKSKPREVGHVNVSSSQLPHTPPLSAERQHSSTRFSPAINRIPAKPPLAPDIELPPFTPPSGRRKRHPAGEEGSDSEDGEIPKMVVELGGEEMIDSELEETYMSHCENVEGNKVRSATALLKDVPLLSDHHQNTPPSDYIRTPSDTPDATAILSDGVGNMDGVWTDDDPEDRYLLDMDDFFDLPKANTDDATPLHLSADDLDLFTLDDCTSDLPIDQAHGAESEVEDYDDGDMLARLMQRAQGLQEGSHALQSASEFEEGMLDMDELDLEIFEEDDHFMAYHAVSADVRTNRRKQALSFLESIPLQLLTQLQASVSHVNAYNSKRLRQATERKKKPKMLNDCSSDEGGEEGEAVDWEKVGVVLRLMNRRTGNPQVIDVPDDPSLPGVRSSGQRRIACIMRVAELLYAATLNGVVCTKRDIFYHDVALFGHQRVVDSLVDDLAATAGLKRQDFCVCATSKGLIVSAHLQITLHGGEELPLSPSNASLIPPIERIAGISTRAGDDEQRGIDWVLVVEKDAVFQTLCSAGLMKRSDIGTGILITGKGYPDLATLQVLSLIARQYPAARIFALVDADPHGLDILSVYRYGSKASRYSADYTDLHLGERLQWMGVKASEWMSLGVRYEDLLSLTDKDVEKAQAMLRNRPDMPATWRRELAHMLHLNKKAEIQILSSVPASFTEQGRDGPEDMISEEEPGFDDGITLEGLMRYVVSKLRCAA